jgi:hypothetical protein
MPQVRPAEYQTEARNTSMPLRLNPFAPATPRAGDAGAGTSGNTPDTASATRQMPVSGVGGLQRKARSMASCLGIPVHSTPSHSELLCAGIDRWAVGHGGPNVAYVCIEIKKLIREPFFSTVFRSNSRGQLGIPNRKLQSIPTELGQVKALRTLHLEWNELTSFPAEIGQAEALHTLYLYKNQLTSFPAEMGQAKALRYLSLSDNQLTSFPAEMGQAKALRTLYLSNNQLTSFPAEMGNAKALETLSLYRNQLNSLPDEIAKLRNCRSCATLTYASIFLRGCPAPFWRRPPMLKSIYRTTPCRTKKFAPCVF